MFACTGTVYGTLAPTYSLLAFNFFKFRKCIYMIYVRYLVGITIVHSRYFAFGIVCSFILHIF